jgi:hypothetical protein
MSLSALDKKLNSKKLNRSKLFSFAFLVTLAGLMVWRSPDLLLAPRFWAEEGSVYFEFAYEHSFIEALYFVDWRAGYLNLIASLTSAIAANATPLEYAPFVTTYVSFIVQFVPFLIIFYGKSKVFRGIWKKIAGCLIILLTPTVIGGVWLNTINLQIYFGLIAVLILLEDLKAVSRARRWVYRFLLALGGMSGVYVVFLQPIFVFKAFIERNKERYIQLTIVTLVLFLQFGLFIASNFQKKLTEKKSLEDIGLHNIGETLYYQLTLPILGKEFTTTTIKDILMGEFPYTPLISIFLSLLLGVILIILLSKARGLISFSDSRITLVLAWFVLAIATNLGSLNNAAGGRYAVLSGFVLLFLILDNIRLNQRPLISMALVVILGMSMYSGLLYYRNYSHYNRLLCDGNNWEQEIKKWRQDPNYEIPICPEPSWEIKLTPNAVREKISSSEKSR